MHSEGFSLTSEMVPGVEAHMLWAELLSPPAWLGALCAAAGLGTFLGLGAAPLQCHSPAPRVGVRGQLRSLDLPEPLIFL